MANGGEKEDLYDQLVNLMESQFNEVIRHARVPEEFLSGPNAARATRAGELDRWAGQSDANRHAVRSALDEVRKSAAKTGGIVDPASLALQPELRDLCLVFGRDEQHALKLRRESRPLEEHIRDWFHGQQRVVVVLLPGPERESHPDFVARYQKFTLRAICRELGYDDVILPWEKRAWPSPAGSTQRRLGRLMTDLSTLVESDAPPSGLDPAAFRERLKTEVAAWMGREKGHRVIAYRLFHRHRCLADAELIRRWVEFWLGLDLRGPSTLTVFLCIEPPSFWLSRWLDRCAFGVCRVRRAFKGKDNVLILDPLVPPTPADVNPWVDEKCDLAWAIAHRSKPAPRLSLNYDALRKGARAAFGKRKRRPFEEIKDELENAITKAHEKFKQWGTGR